MTCAKISKWNTHADQLLSKLIEHEHIVDWAQISRRITQSFPNFIRSPKQCRQRYTNFVKFREENQDWSPNDMLALKEQYLQKGPKWVNIAKHFSTKPQNSIKNKFNAELRKTLRKINSYRLTTKSRNRKPFESDWFNKLSKAVFGGEATDSFHQREAQGLLREFVQVIFDSAIEGPLENPQNQRESYDSLISRITNYNRNFLFLKKKEEEPVKSQIVIKVEVDNRGTEKGEGSVTNTTKDHHRLENLKGDMSIRVECERLYNLDSMQLEKPIQVKQGDFEIKLLNYYEENQLKIPYQSSFDHFDLLQ